MTCWHTDTQSPEIDMGKYSNLFDWWVTFKDGCLWDDVSSNRFFFLLWNTLITMQEETLKSGWNSIWNAFHLRTTLNKTVGFTIFSLKLGKSSQITKKVHIELNLKDWNILLSFSIIKVFLVFKTYSNNLFLTTQIFIKIIIIIIIKQKLFLFSVLFLLEKKNTLFFVFFIYFLGVNFSGITLKSALQQNIELKWINMKNFQLVVL